jgi:hypothetical protein
MKVPLSLRVPHSSVSGQCCQRLQHAVAAGVEPSLEHLWDIGVALQPLLHIPLAQTRLHCLILQHSTALLCRGAGVCQQACSTPTTQSATVSALIAGDAVTPCCRLPHANLVPSVWAMNMGIVVHALSNLSSDVDCIKLAVEQMHEPFKDTCPQGMMLTGPQAHIEDAV